MANTIPIIHTAKNRSFIRYLYDEIAANTAMRGQSIKMFKEFVSPVADPELIASCLTEEERRNLRDVFLQTALKDLSAGADSAMRADSFFRYGLEQDYRVLQLLQPLTSEDKAEDLLTYATLCFAVDRCREAQDLFQVLSSLLPGNLFVQSSLAFQTSCVSLPRFRHNFISRCKFAWKNVFFMAQKFHAGELNLDDLQAAARNNFAIWTGLELIVAYASDGTGTFALSPLEWRQDLIPLQTALDIGCLEIPTDLAKRWDIGLLNRPVGDPDRPGRPFFAPDSIQTIAEDTPDHTGIRLQLYHPFLPTAPAGTNLVALLSNEVSSLLGTPDFCLLIHSIEPLTEPPQSSTGMLESLPQQLEALGYTLDHDMDEVEPLRLHREYTRQPQEGADLPLRDDITRGDTVCWPLQEEYDRYETAAMDRFMDQGIAPVFLAWPRSIMNCDEETFTQRLQDAIAKNAAGSAKVLGRASGTQYCYLDLLAWTTIPLVSAAERFFSRIPGGDAARIQSFYCDATPCPVSQQYLQTTSAIHPSGLPFPLETSGTSFSKGTPPAHPKSKKKNAAKAKRKHSKKFH